jgi:GDP-4-dehydro-6-deoxy-D-mannose reductase
VRVLVTGADGFVGGWLVRALLGAGHAVGGTRGPDGGVSRVLTPEEQAGIDWRPLDLRDSESVRAAVRGSWDAVVHLAAVASGGEARRDPGLAWSVNAAGTARLAEALLPGNPLLLLVSTGEVYGQGTGALRKETDPVAPCSPYAASKAGAELAAQEVARRAGLRLVVARPFPHTGPGQDGRFVLPALAARLRLAHRIGAPAINTGSLEPVRDLLDVRDVATAYLALLRAGRDGEIYNIASGQGHRLADLLRAMQRLLGSRVIAEYDPALARGSDILHLVGDASRLRAATGWMPGIPLDQTLRDLLDAQTD